MRKEKKRAVVKVLLLFFLEEEEEEDAQKKEAKRHAFGEESSSLKTFIMCIHEERDARLMSLKSVLSTSSFTFPKYETLYTSLLGVLCSLGYHIERILKNFWSEEKERERERERPKPKNTFI